MVQRARLKKMPLFKLGSLVATPGAIEALRTAEVSPGRLLVRHQGGDWGNLSQSDQAENTLSVEKGWRILSAYVLSTGVKVWVITEADRSSTCILLPEEY
jgi:hypothetical protein